MARRCNRGRRTTLGQNFAKAYDIKFVDADRRDQARLHDVVGSFVAHARRSDHGRTATIAGCESRRRWRRSKRCLIPIVRSSDERAVERCDDARRSVLTRAGFRVRVDARDAQPGWKYSEWDLRGVPVRIEIGPRDVDAQTAVLARRDRNQRRAGSARRASPSPSVPAALRETARRHPALALRRRRRRFLSNAHLRDDRSQPSSSSSAAVAPE